MSKGFKKLGTVQNWLHECSMGLLSLEKRLDAVYMEGLSMEIKGE
jgi:hypothetical protein